MLQLLLKVVVLHVCSICVICRSLRPTQNSYSMKKWMFEEDMSVGGLSHNGWVGERGMDVNEKSEEEGQIRYLNGG